MRWRRHQREALDAIADSADTRHWVVLPPGAGKTLAGVGAAASWGRPVVAFAPNVAIVSQWRAAWTAMTGEPATSDRDLPTGFTALTYQSLAVFDGEADGDSQKARLHPNGLALVERLHDAGPLTLVLDECHHLLEVWGDLLDEIIAGLPDAIVVALTATPPEMLTATQAARVERLFGDITYQAGIPALVAEGDLAPFAELAWFTTPSAREEEWLDARTVRARELVSELTRVDAVDVPLLSWLDLHDWRDLQPDVADAVVRLALAGHLPLPENAHVTERHRTPVTLDDWLTVAEGWLIGLRDGDDDAERAFQRRIATLLPGVGYRFTRHGIRPGHPLVDRVLSRSSSKAAAAVEIAARTLADDDRARLLVLTDHARAAALPADLDGVVEPQSGSVHWLLEALVADGRLAGARPIAVTGSTIGAEAHVLRELLPDEDIGQGDGVVVLEGSTADRWLRAATEALNRGWTRCLVGTRGLLGEGWNARAVSGVIDLTSATTSTAIVQTRGRSLRTDPDRPDKVAVNWTVTCVAPDRPQGDADYRRLVRKHEGWFAVDEEGDIVDGVAHLDSHLSPSAPPTAIDTLNARALARAADATAIRDAWAHVDPARENAVVTLRITADRGPAPVALRPLPTRKELTPKAPVGLAGLGIPAAAVAAMLGFINSPTAAAVILVSLVLFLGEYVLRAAQVRASLATEPATSDYARAVADALREGGSSPVGAEGVRVEVTSGGETRVHLEGVAEAVTQEFVTALAEVLGPIEQPRYLISRPAWDRHRLHLRHALRPPAPDREVWHQVPTLFGGSAARAEVFRAAWARRVRDGRLVYVGNPEGAGLLAALRWTSPFGDGAGMRIVERRHW